MLDINILRNNFNEVAKRIRERNKEYPQLDQFKVVDEQWRKLTAAIQQLNSERNLISKDISVLIKDKKDAEAQKLKEKVQDIKQKTSGFEKEIVDVELQLEQIMRSIPNIPAADVPVGKDEQDNPEIRKWGTPRAFEFKSLPHWELAEKNDLVDFERSVKLSGSRFTIYRGDGAKLIRALQWFTLDMNTKAGFFEMLPPIVVNDQALLGTGTLPKFEEDVFKLNTNQYLSPTAEVQLTCFYRNEILNEKQLPLHFTANTACFRSEAGSAGKDTRGVIRQHQFYKTEMVMITKPDDSYASLEKMVNQAESILKALELPYRVILLCTGDQGFASAKTYDIEVWLPSYNAYKEISSCSNCESFQARNLKIRYRDPKQNDLVFPHTLNGSGLAIDRLWAAIVENYQQANGTIKLPKVLQKYFDNAEFLK